MGCLRMSAHVVGHLWTAWDNVNIGAAFLREKCRQLSGVVAAPPLSTMEQPEAVNRALVEWMMI
jgi:hypothetical protein